MKKAFYILISILIATIAANSSERLVIMRCKIVNLTSFPKKDWPYQYSFITDWECDTLETNFLSLSTFGNYIEHTTTELGELSINLYQPYISYSLISDILPIADSLSIYISACQNKINEYSIEYIVETQDSTTINCAVTDVLGVFYVDSCFNKGGKKDRAILVSLISCSHGSKINFVNKKNRTDDSACRR